MKKLGLFIGVFFLLLMSAIVIIPLVVDVDKYRPQIENAANQRINGTLSLGKLSLSLWGQVRIEVGGLKVLNPRGDEVLGVKEAYFHLPFFSLLSGSPVLTFKMKDPLIHVIKNKAGQLNLMSLMKPTAKPTGGASLPPGQTPAPSAPSTPKELPGILTRARLGLELRNALLTYSDQMTGMKAEVKDLNLILTDLSLTHPTEIQLWADLNTQMGSVFHLRGPARLEGKVQPTLKENQFDSVQMSAHLDMDQVQLEAPGLFIKKAGMATQADLVLTGSEQEIKLEDLSIRFFNALLKVKGNVLQPTAKPRLQFAFESNEIQLGPWVELIPMLKEYELSGSARMTGSVAGTADLPSYQALLTVSKLTAKAPGLKVQPQFNGEVRIKTDEIEKFLLTLTAPGNDLKVQGSLVSFSRPRLNAQVTSPGMDLDQLIDFSQSGQKKPLAVAPANPNAVPPPPGLEGAQQVSSKSSANPPVDLDALLDPLRKNPMAVAAVATVSVAIKALKAHQVQIADIACKMSLKELTAGLDPCGFKVFGGSVKVQTQMHLKPKTPTYQFGLHVDGLEMAQAMKSQMELFKNTLTGKAHFDMNGNGASFNTAAALSSLTAKGSMKVSDATFATLDIMKMVSEALSKSLEKVGEKVPAIKGKTVSLPSTASQYEFISSDFSIARGVFSAPHFQAKAKPNLGIDLKGSTTVGMIDQKLEASWQVIDTYNMTHLKDLSINQSGIQVDHLLAEGNSPIHFPIHVGCTTKTPCFSYADVPESFAKIAFANLTRAATGKGKAEVQKKAESLIDQYAPPAMKQDLKDKLKGFFH